MSNEAAERLRQDYGALWTQAEREAFDAALIVYAVNHIEATEAALAEALALLRKAQIWLPVEMPDVSRIQPIAQLRFDIRAFLAAHPAPQGEEPQ